MSGDWYQAKTTSGCSDPNNSLSTWIGLGGEPSLNSGPQLDQVGVVATASGTHYFWEIITGPQTIQDTSEVYFGGTEQPIAADEIMATLNYYPNGDPGATTGPTTRFFVENLRTYSVYAFDEATPAINGRTAEAIDERHTHSGVMTMLRKQVDNGIATGTYWASAGAAVLANGTQTQLRAWSHRQVDMTKGSTTYETFYGVPNTTQGTLDGWVSCGSTG